MPQQLPEEILYDVRLTERHLNKGLVNPKELEKRLAALEDQAPQAEYTNLDELMKAPSRSHAAVGLALNPDRSVN